MKTRMITFAFVTLVSLSFTACKKEIDQSRLSIRMTDAPTALEEVNIDLKEVKVNFSQDTAGWLTMEAIPGVYNLLDLQNGIDTLISQGTYPVNQMVHEVRLVLGPNNTVKSNGEVYPLTIPSGSESGLKIKINKKLRATFEEVLIDFDAALSVSEENDGYKLRPVIKVK